MVHILLITIDPSTATEAYTNTMNALYKTGVYRALCIVQRTPFIVHYIAQYQRHACENVE